MTNLLKELEKMRAQIAALNPPNEVAMTWYPNAETWDEAIERNIKLSSRGLCGLFYPCLLPRWPGPARLCTDYDPATHTIALNIQVHWPTEVPLYVRADYKGYDSNSELPSFKKPDVIEPMSHQPGEPIHEVKPQKRIRIDYPDQVF
jgi:hypothetical protein